MKSAIAFCAMLFSASSFAQMQGPPVSLLNIGTGYMPYTWASRSNQYIGFNYADVLGGYESNASWYPIYHDDGTVSFKDLKRGYCIQFYDTNDRVVQNPCDFNNSKMKFKLETTTTGALLIKFQSNGQCLYGTPSLDEGYIYSGQCYATVDYNWAMIPPLSN